MNETYRTAQLENARKELADARAKLAAISGWSSKKREASEMVEFWSNKVSFLSQVKAA